MRRPDALAGRRPPELSRRKLLGGIGGASIAAGAAKAADNVLLGYGALTGTNLREQDLASRVRERFTPLPATTTVGGVDVSVTSEMVVVDPPANPPRRFGTADERAAAETDADLGLDGSLAALLADLRSLSAGEETFAFSRTSAFLDRIGAAAPRPATVAALRGDRYTSPDPEAIRRFTGADPAATDALIDGLARGFREFASYDVERYLAGSIEDNLLLGAGDLRAPFRSATDFETLLDSENVGLFCYDFAYRSIEAFHAVPAPAQTAPVLGVVVADARHKHVYTGIASVIRDGSDLVIPMTFVDYMHATLNAQFGLRAFLGEGIEAYDDRHRTTDVFWNDYAHW